MSKAEQEPLLSGAGLRRGSLNALKEEYISPRPRNLGVCGAVASILNAVIGTGILALPVAFSQLGVGLASLTIVICAGVVLLSLVCLSEVVTKVGGTSYGHTMELTVGGWSGPFISVIVGAFTFGVCVVYSVVISSNLRDLFFDQGWITTPIIPPPAGDVLDNRRIWVLASSIGVITPLCLLPNFDKLKYVATFAASSMIYLAGVIAVYLFVSASRGDVPTWSAGIGQAPGAPEGVMTPIGPRDARVTSPLLHPDICCVPMYTASDGVPGCVEAVEDDPEGPCCVAVAPEVCCTTEQQDRGVVQWEAAEGFILNSDIFVSFSTFLFAFLTHTMIPQVVVELIEPSTRRLTYTMAGVAGGSLALYYVVGLTGYLLFSNCVCDNISLSFGSSNFVAVGQLFVVLSVCCGYPTVCWPCRDALLELTYPLFLKITKSSPREPSMLLKRCTAIFIVATGSTIAWFDPPFGTVLALLGAVGGGLCGFVMPSLSYMMIYHPEKSLTQQILCTRPGWCFIASCIFFFVNTFFVIYNEIFVDANPGDGANRACAPLE